MAAVNDPRASLVQSEISGAGVCVERRTVLVCTN